jgi:A/G-specific adenine glycosylase
VPAAKAKKPPRAVDAVTLLAERGEALLLVRRPPSGLWGGLWEPPVRELARAGKGAADGPPDEAAARAAAQELGAALGLQLADIRALGRFEHVLTHRRMRFCAFTARARGRVRPALDGYDAHVWQPRAQALEVGVAAWTRKLLERARQPELV